LIRLLVSVDAEEASKNRGQMRNLKAQMPLHLSRRGRGVKEQMSDEKSKAANASPLEGAFLNRLQVSVDVEEASKNRGQIRNLKGQMPRHLSRRGRGVKEQMSDQKSKGANASPL